MGGGQEQGAVSGVGYDRLLADVRAIIAAGRGRVAAAINQELVATYWAIGERIVREEQGGTIAHLYAARATTQERTGAIRTPVGDGGDAWKQHTMGYFFAVLEDRLGLRERTVGD